MHVSSAFDELYRRYSKRIAGLVRRMVHRGSEIEDVLQEIFLQVHQSLPRFEGRSSLSTWIYQLATNVTLHHIRASSRRFRCGTLHAVTEAQLTRPVWLAGSCPERDAEFNGLVRETARVIGGLRPVLRQVMVMVPVEGRSCESVARMLGTSTEVVKSRLHRARTATREAMWRVERRGTQNPTFGRLSHA